MNNSQTISERLKAFINASGLSVRRFAVIFELDLANLYKWITGTKPSDIEIYKKLESIINGDFVPDHTGYITTLLREERKQTIEDTAKMLEISIEDYTKYERMDVSLSSISNTLFMKKLKKLYGERLDNIFNRSTINISHNRDGNQHSLQGGNNATNILNEPAQEYTISNKIQHLKDLQKMLVDGIITDDEFKILKKQIV